MEIIKKQISIDACRSHKSGLLPFVHSNNGSFIEDTSSANTNYGHFVCDLRYTFNDETIEGIYRKEVFKGNKKYEELLNLDHEEGDKWCLTEDYKVDNITIYSGGTILKYVNNSWITYEDIKYLDIIRRYNEIKEILRSAIYCKCEKNVLKICEAPILESCSGLCESGKTFYDYEPKDITDFYIKNNKTFIPNIDEEDFIISGVSYILLNDYNVYNEHEVWGKEYGLSSGDSKFSFYKYVDENIIQSSSATNDFELIVPNVEVPILFEDEYVVDTLYYPYEYSLTGKTNEILNLHGISLSANVGETLLTIYDIELNSATTSSFTIFSCTTVNDNIEVESRLEKLRHYSSLEIAEGFDGILKDWTESGATLCKCTYNNGWSIITGITSNRFKCVDGEVNVTPNTDVYRNITLLGCIPHYIPNPQNGDIYYFMVRYKNDEENLLSFPFKVGEPVNIETYDGDTIYDMVLSTEIESLESGATYCNISYVLGATSGINDTGIIYHEKLLYESGITTVLVENLFESELYYEKLNYDSNLKLVYNNDYGVSCYIRPAYITQMEVGKVFQETIKIPLITKEGSENLYSPPQLSLDIEFNRGNAAGWEKHFKLSECNTMRDLKNYGNNVFNL